MNNKLKENRSILVFFAISLGITVLFSLLLLIAIVTDSMTLIIISSLIFILGSIALLIYFIIYYASWIGDINIVCNGDGRNSAGALKMVLLTLFSLSWLWEYDLQDRISSNEVRYGVTIRETGSTVLLWSTLGQLLGVGPWVALHILFQSTNKLVHAYNEGGFAAVGNGAGKFENHDFPESPEWENELPADSSEFPFHDFPQGEQEDSEGMKNPFASSDMPNKESGQAAVMGKVQCVRGSAKGQGFQLPANSKVVIGKNPGKANLVINDSRVSNVHCSIQYNAENNTYIVTDLSTNGTFLNGTKLQKSVPVTCQAGSRITLVDDSNEILLG